MNETEIQAWKEFSRELKRRVRWEGEKIEGALNSALKFLPTLEGDERAALLRMGRVVAERSGRLAVAFLRMGPKTFSSLPPPCRRESMQWAMVFANHSRETLIDFLEKSEGILATLPREDRSFYLAQGVKLAAHDPSVSFKYFISLPRIQKEVPRNQFPPWFEEGLSLIPRNLPAALAYFGHESKHSRDRAQERSSCVTLDEVLRPLRIFAQALTGKRLGFRPLKEVRGGYLHPWEARPCTDGEIIFLPQAIGDYPSPDLNFLAFKLATAHQAGYIEFGTFQFKLSSLSDLFPPDFLRACLQGISDRGKRVSPLEAFFQLFAKKELAVDLFTVLEGARIDRRLRREYRGMGKEMDLFLPLVMAKRPGPESLPLREALLEFLLRIGVGREPQPPLSPFVENLREDLVAVINPLLHDGATVSESARATVMVYRWLSSLPNIPLLNFEERREGKIFFPTDRHLFQAGGMEFPLRPHQGEEPYRSLVPLPHWGELRPELVQKKIRLRQVESLLQEMEIGIPLSPEALKGLLEKGLEMEVEILPGQDGGAFQGLFITDLKGMKKPIHTRQATEKARERLREEMHSILGDLGADPDGERYYYDEWDYQIGDYRLKWCCLKEREMEAGSPGFVDQTLESYSHLVAEVRKQFQMLKPERFKKIPHLERGEEIDLNAAIEASVDRRAGLSPSEKIYMEKNRKDRDFATIFLLDMSASTDELAEEREKGRNPSPASPGEKKVIDIEREALVVMAEALEEIGDEYAIFGFSGYGRKEVDFYSIKDFQEGYGDQVKGRIGKIKPQRSTRMGTAIRHAVEKIASRESKVKNLILISDGYPQDYDYGEDRGDKEYALQDTLTAMEEARRKNIHTFCITVDRAGHDYLRKMCPPSRYLVIEETTALPRELPKIYRRLTT